jgi:RsiW-degrading membrane proteinase PrsW (M82 family)
VETLFFTLLPAIVVVSFIYFSNKFAELKLNLIKAFLLGIFICFPAGILNSAAIKTFGNDNDINNALLMGFMAGGLVEELLKFTVLYLYFPSKTSFKRYDVVIFALFISLGFAVYENFGYVFAKKYSEISFEVAFARAFTAVPMHIFNGIIMGYFFEFYLLKKNRKFLGYAVLLPIFLHGCYNFFCSQNLLISKAIILMMIFLAYRLNILSRVAYK